MRAREANFAPFLFGGMECHDNCQPQPPNGYKDSENAQGLGGGERKVPLRAAAEGITLDSLRAVCRILDSLSRSQQAFLTPAP